jgi:hypothetical protein
VNKPLTMWFDDKGNLLLSAYKWSRGTGKTEIAKDFDDHFDYLRMDSGLGMARVHFKSVVTGREYSMFIDDFNDLIRARRFNNNQVEGKFRFVKRGQSQTIKLILEKPATP